MRKSDLEQMYSVVNGVIFTPGKFEGEPIYVPYFWDIYLNGFCDHDDGRVITFAVTMGDQKEFPELKGKWTVYLAEDDQGFVREVRR